ncbi:MAG: peptide deformylase [Minisyncoccia bacterium]
MKRIVQKDTPVLRELAKEVPVTDIGTPRIQRVLQEMKDSLDSQEDGVAIAAPQIGYGLRIFIVSGRVAALIKRKDKIDGAETEEKNIPEVIYNDQVYINPVIKKISKEKRWVEEGCLSVRYLYGQVQRSKKATVEAYDESGKKFIKPGSGLLAQIFQHETDHLNGILFIDKARNIEDLPPEKNKK